MMTDEPGLKQKGTNGEFESGLCKLNGKFKR